MLHRRRAIAALIACWVTACGDSTEPSPPEFVGMRILSGGGATDTIDTRLAQALVVEVRDEQGEPIADHPLRFTTVPVNPNQPFAGYMAYVSSPDRNDYGTFASDRTDSRGRARVLVALGRSAGTAIVIVTDPDHATADTAEFTVQPGAAVRVVAAPEDTSVYIGRTVTLRSAVVDRYGNPRTDPITHTVTGSEVTLSGTTVTGVALGTATIVVTAGGRADTTTVTVPPEGTLAAFTSGGLVTFKTDGSDFRVVARPPSQSPFFPYSYTTAWSPSGTEVVFDDEWRGPIRAATLSGTVRAVSPGTAWAVYPTYSPDGQWVYYSRDGWRLYRVRPDGTGDEAVPMTTPTSDVAPSLSPDGTRLVYVSVGGGDRLRLLDLASGASTDLNMTGHQPAWSPNGSLIAFIAGGAIRVMNPDGTGARTVSAAGSTYLFGGIDWSPDSQWIVARSSTRSRLEVLNATTGQTIGLAGTAGLAAPSWKP